MTLRRPHLRRCLVAVAVIATTAAVPLTGGTAGAQVAPVDKLSVVLVAVFAVLFLGEQLSTAHWIAILMIGGGALLLALPI